MKIQTFLNKNIKSIDEKEPDFEFLFGLMFGFETFRDISKKIVLHKIIPTTRKTTKSGRL